MVGRGMRVGGGPTDEGFDGLGTFVWMRARKAIPPVPDEVPRMPAGMTLHRLSTRGRVVARAARTADLRLPRRATAVVAAVVLAGGVAFPVSAGAQGLGAVVPALPAVHVPPLTLPIPGTGSLAPLRARRHRMSLVSAVVLPTDVVSAGWTVSMPESHPAATDVLSAITATVPLTCVVLGQRPRLVDLVLHMPDVTQTIAAGDTSWRPTTSTAAAAGYQVGSVVGSLCSGGLLFQAGATRYSATLLSTDLTDRYAIRYHSVDARLNIPRLGHNTNCMSVAQNPTGVAQCSAPWSAVNRVLASGKPLLPSTNGSHPPAGGGGVTGIVPSLVGRVVTVVRRELRGASQALSLTGSAPAGQPAQLGAAQPAAGGSATATAGAPSSPGNVPADRPSAPSLPRIGPVPALPAIGGVTAAVGGSLPWNWFLVLAIIDIGLIVALVVRRRRTPGGVDPH